MTFCARYRFKILFPFTNSNVEACQIEVDGFPPATLTQGNNARPVGKWVIIQINGISTKSEALQLGRSLGDLLTIVGATTRIGIDVVT
jgi:hypothetical protein